MDSGDEDVRAILARANLHKLRGQWEDAAALCAEAIQRDPTSAAAHGLLGEVYEGQGSLDQALHCYGMAVDLAPDNASWRQSLQKMVRRKQAALKNAQKAAPVRPRREKTLEWIDRKFPPGQPKSILYFLVGFGALLAVILGIGAGLLLTGRGRERKPTMTRIDAPAPKTIEIATPAPPAPSPVAPAPSPSPEPDQPQSLTVPGAASASFDPQSATASVAMTVPAPPGKEAPEVRELLLRQAAYLGKAALLAAPDAQRVIVRVDLMRAETAEPGFSGEAVPAGLSALVDPDAADIAALTGAFTSFQWAPSLAGGGNSPPTQ